MSWRRGFFNVEDLQAGIALDQVRKDAFAV